MVRWQSLDSNGGCPAPGPTGLTPCHGTMVRASDSGLPGLPFRVLPQGLGPPPAVCVLVCPNLR